MAFLSAQVALHRRLWQVSAFHGLRHRMIAAPDFIPSGQKKTRNELCTQSGSYSLATSYSHRAYRPTTIGAASFHCRVRDGNGWVQCAMVTRGWILMGGCRGCDFDWDWVSCLLSLPTAACLKFRGLGALAGLIDRCSSCSDDPTVL